jgi:hypothetical protein
VQLLAVEGRIRQQVGELERVLVEQIEHVETQAVVPDVASEPEIGAQNVVEGIAVRIVGPAPGEERLSQVELDASRETDGPAQPRDVARGMFLS